MPHQNRVEMRGIVRIAGVGLKGEKKIYVSLQRIKGVGSIYS